MTETLNLPEGMLLIDGADGKPVGFLFPNGVPQSAIDRIMERYTPEEIIAMVLEMNQGRRET